MARPAYEWTGNFDANGYENHYVTADSRKACEAALKAAIDEHYRNHPDQPVEDAWMNTPAMSASDKDFEPNGVMTMVKLNKIRKELGRNDVEIMVGGIVFK